MKKITDKVRNSIVKYIVNKYFSKEFRKAIILEFLDEVLEHYSIACYLGKNSKLPYYATESDNYTETDFDLYMDLEGDSLETIGVFEAYRADASNVVPVVLDILKSLIK